MITYYLFISLTLSHQPTKVYLEVFLIRIINFYENQDMDGDGFIGTTDIEHALKLLTQNELNMDEIQSVWEKV